jgi:hypothetical protein
MGKLGLCECFGSLVQSRLCYRGRWFCLLVLSHKTGIESNMLLKRQVDAQVPLGFSCEVMSIVRRNEAWFAWVVEKLLQEPCNFHHVPAYQLHDVSTKN